MGLFSRKKSKEPKPEEQVPKAEASEDEAVHLSVDEMKLSNDSDGMVDLLINGDDPEARMEAAWALVELKDERTADALLGIIRSDEPDSLRFQAIGALGKLHAPDAIEPLIGVLSDQNEDAKVRAGAAVSLGWMGDQRAAEPLAEVWLKADEDIVQQKAGEAFMELKVGSSDVLVAALGDPQLASKAAERLAKFADKTVIPTLQETAERAKAAKEKGLAKSAEEAIKSIQERVAA